MPPAVFLDRDGVLIKDKHYLCEPEQVELLPGVAAGLARLVAAGLLPVVVSNQSGVGRGYFTCAEVDAVHARMQALLAAQGVPLRHVYYCPHAPPGKEGNQFKQGGREARACVCRKPAPGLIHAAVADLGIQLKGSFMIGDKRSDVALGRAVGIPAILVTTGHGAAELARPGPAPDFVAVDFTAAAAWILEQLHATSTAEGHAGTIPPERPSR
ncbi:MAG: HAD family hydrolase [Desulfovibrio sp.]|nr:HAD family hydrolase [Desulfovibrio sp.]MCA1984869.1 HAD family hydrolase [Desulfovibrio sp.]